MLTFSIIVPVYNVAPYLRECLDSIICQDNNSYEICIVDDGSTDGSGVICDEYNVRYREKIKLFHQENQGVSAARNRALDMADGRYIWFVDADDFILPGSLNYLQALIHQTRCDTVFFGDMMYDGNDNIVFETDKPERFLNSHVCYFNQRMIFHRNIIEEKHLRFTEGMRMSEDLEFQYKYLLHCQHPVSINYNFYFYRIRKGSACRNQNTRRASIDGNEKLLFNLAIYLKKDFSGKIPLWLGERILKRIRKYPFLVSRLPAPDWRQAQRTYEELINTYSTLELRGVNSCLLYFARNNMRLYAFLYRIILKCNRFFMGKKKCEKY